MSPFHGPLSDALGRQAGDHRRRRRCTSLASVGCALSPTLESLLVFRVLQGLSAGGGVIVSRTVIRDVFEGAEAQRLMSRVMMIFSLAPGHRPGHRRRAAAGRGRGRSPSGSWPAVALLLVVVVVVRAPRDPPAPSAGSRCASAPLVAQPRARSPAAPAFHRVAWAAALTFGGQFIYVSAASIIVVDLLGLGELDFWVLFAPLVGAVLDRVADQQLGRRAGSRATVLVTGSLLFCVGAAPWSTSRSPPPSARRCRGWCWVRRCSASAPSAAYPTMQLILLDMFPAGRGAAVSLFTFFTLLLNGADRQRAGAARHRLGADARPGLDRDGRGRAAVAGCGTSRSRGAPHARRLRRSATRPV